jgi:hypothetical protein
MREATKLALQRIEPGDALRRADHERDERPPLPALGVADQPGARRRRRRERLHVAEDLVGRRDLLADIVADDLACRRNGRVVARAGRKLGCLDPLERRGECEKGEHP